MPTPTYTPLANITLGSSAAGVTFSSISQSYRDLRLVFTGTTTSLANVLFQFNGDGAANYAKQSMAGRSGSSPAANSSTTSSAHINNLTATSSTMQSFGTVDIFDYSATDKHKSYISRNASQEGDGTYSGTEVTGGRWINTAAITTLYVVPGAGSFVTGSTFALYGIAS